MSRPATDFAAQANREDLVSIILDLKKNVLELQRDANQSGRSLGWSVTTPAVPATTVTATNTTGKPVTVYIRGGTVTNIAVDGTLLGMTSGTFRVNAGGTIAVTYSVVPTWFWYGD
jgi:hypothetical protein